MVMFCGKRLLVLVLGISEVVGVSLLLGFFDEIGLSCSSFEGRIIICWIDLLSH